jgi:hypothetical protein
METIQADRAARQTKRNPSAPVRDVQSLEERDRAGYSERPPARDEIALWEAEAAWPPE